MTERDHDDVNITVAAERIGVSRVTVWRWIREGRLLAAKLGHRTTPQPGGTFVVSIASDPGHFNPAITTGFTQHVVADSIFNGLVGLDENLAPVPDLADSWVVSDDGTAYTLSLIHI